MRLTILSFLILISFSSLAQDSCLAFSKIPRWWFGVEGGVQFAKHRVETFFDQIEATSGERHRFYMWSPWHDKAIQPFGRLSGGMDWGLSPTWFGGVSLGVGGYPVSARRQYMVVPFDSILESYTWDYFQVKGGIATGQVKGRFTNRPVRWFSWSITLGYVFSVGFGSKSEYEEILSKAGRSYTFDWRTEVGHNFTIGLETGFHFSDHWEIGLSAESVVVFGWRAGVQNEKVMVDPVGVNPWLFAHRPCTVFLRYHLSGFKIPFSMSMRRSIKKGCRKRNRESR